MYDLWDTLKERFMVDIRNWALICELAICTARRSGGPGSILGTTRIKK
jgi:hypothetical protein